MKEFLKYTLAVIVGIHISAILLFFVGVGLMGAMLASKSSSVKTQDNTFLVLNLDGQLTERYEDSPIDKILGSALKKQGLDQILEAIELARKNPHITGIYIEAGNLEASTASLQEIRSSLKRFRDEGKTIITYGDNYSQGLYYLSSISNRVILNPIGTIEWKGMAAQLFFFKDLLEKVGVNIQLFRVGNYKSAVEPYTRNSMSEDNKLQYTELLQSLWKEITKEVSESRNISVDSLNQFAENGIFFATTQEFLNTGLVDTLLYREETRNFLKKLTQVKEKEAPRFITVDEILRTNPESSNTNNQIAIYYAYGEIDIPSSPTEGILSKRVIQDLQKLQDNENIKAVVIRINSPGGSAFGSEQIWKAVHDLNRIKPVIVSMGDYAASGGYYIASAATAIVAQPTTLTGSIGIFGIIPSFERTGEKLGIQTDRVTTHPHSDMYSLSRPFSPKEHRLMQDMLERGYELFLTRCAEGRKTDKETVNKIAQGRIWAGNEAKEVNLVDQLGGLSDAIGLAAEKSQLTEYSVKKYPKEKSFLESLLDEEPILEIKTKILNSIPGYKLSNQIEKEVLNSNFQPQMRIPYQIVME